MKKVVKSIGYSKCLVLAGSLLMSPSALSAGKKPVTDTTPSCGTPSGYTTPNPRRKVILLPIQTKAFQLPNGSVVSLNADLESLLKGSLSNNPSFTVTDPSSSYLCDTHLEIRSAVTTLDMNVVDFGVTFGYSPAGVQTGLTNITGQANVKVGTLTMNFDVYQCIAGSCSSVAGTTVTQASVSGSLNMVIDFNSVTSSPSLVFNTPLGTIIQKMMLSGMNALASSSRLNELAWQATVRDYIPAAGLVIFDAGVNSGIGLNQAFEIYAQSQDPTTPMCNTVRTVAYAHTTQVDTVASTALIDQVIRPEGVQIGDVVMIHTVAVK